MSDDLKTVALVVDDVKPNRKLLNSLLTREGYLVAEAESGEQAVELVQQQHIDIIFMDVMMPGMGGYEATRQIKVLLGERFIPVILVTALDEHQGMATGIASGADDYITKPIDAILLKAKVHAMERIRKLHQIQYQQNRELREIQARIADEQKLAESIMNTAISQRKDHIDGIKAIVEPAEIFSGDLVLQSNTPDGGWMAMVGDFTGHGLPAAVGTVPVTETFYSMAGKGLPPASILNELNFKLKNFLPTNMFMGCQLMAFSPEDSVLRLWNGGMPKALLKNRELGTIAQTFESTDLPLGIIEKSEADFVFQDVKLGNGDVLVVYSDGLIEAENEAGEQFGLDKLESVIEASAAGNVQGSILAAWQNFQAEGKQLDDVTLVTVSF